MSGSMGGIVFQEMRESRGLCYSSWAWYARASYKGECNYFTKGVLSQNDKLNECITTLDAICNDLPLSKTAFDNAKQSLVKQIEQRRYVRDNPIWSYLSFRDLGWDHDVYEDVYKEVQQLTLDDVIKFQKERVAGRSYRYTILGNPKELDMKFLKTLGPVKKLKLKDIFVY